MNSLRVQSATLEAVANEIQAASSLLDPVIEERARAIVSQVREQGDEALYELTQRFDQADVRSLGLRVTEDEIAVAAQNVAADLEQAIATSRANVAAFSEHSKRVGWTERNHQGALVGEKFDPFQRVGIYIPGGTAPLISTAVMTITLAKVAGCEEIVVTTPCGPDGSINPDLLHAVHSSGATEIYRIGGAQAIAALALGVESIGKTQKVFGPGNAYVVAAKRALFGSVAIDLLPGPSELLVIADHTAPTSFIAADLIAQAEHGSGHERVWLLSTSPKILEETKEQVAAQIASRSRRDAIEQALAENGYLIEVDSVATAVELTNRIAPEHCEIMAEDDEAIAAGLRTAGAIFLGPYSPTALGDYVAGPSHVLPTGGAGASFGGLTVDQFQRRTSVVRSDQNALRDMWPAVETLAGLEGLDGHSRSVGIRLDS